MALEKNRAVLETGVMNGKKKGPDYIRLSANSAIQKLIVC